MKNSLLIAIVFLALTSNVANAIVTPTGMIRHTKAQDISSKLPADKAKLFQAKDAELKEKYKNLNIKISALDKGMKKLIEAPAFDKKEYEKQAAEIEKVKHEKFELRTAAIEELAAKFTQEERKILVGAFEDNTVCRSARRR